jgi:hypothetical protein
MLFFLNLRLLWKVAVPTVFCLVLMATVAWQAVNALTTNARLAARAADLGARQTSLAGEARHTIAFDAASQPAVAAA